jgi:RHS repeat-associated protein
LSIFGFFLHLGVFLMASLSRFLRHRDRFWDALLAKPAGSSSPSTKLQFLPLEERVVPDARPLPYPYIFAGAGSGAPPQVVAYKADTGVEAFRRDAFEPTFAGGVRVATGDVTGDQFPDLIVGAGPGGGPRVRIFDAITGKVIAGPLGDFFAYSSTFTGGVFVASGDVNGDGHADVITAAGAGGGPHIKVFDGKSGEQIRSFFAFDPNFLGGATVAAADFTGDGKVDLAVGAGAGGGPHVKIFDLQTKNTITTPIGSFFAFDPSFTGGVDVGTDWKAGDVTGDGQADLVVGAGQGGGPHVKVFNGVTGAEVSSFFAFDSSITAGVRVGTAYVSDDKYADVVVGLGQGPTAKINVFDGQTMKVLPSPMGSYTPFGNSFTGGLYIAASNDPPTPGGGGPIARSFQYAPTSTGETNGDPVATAPGAANNGVPGQDYGVRSDGAVDIALVKLPASNSTSGSMQNFAIGWSNSSAYADGTAGAGTTQANTSRLKGFGPGGENGLAVVSGPLSARFYNAQSGGGFQAAFGHSSALVENTSTKVFVLTDGEGAKLEYYSLDSSNPAARLGKWKKRTDKAGNIDEVTSWTTDGNILTLDSTAASGAVERLQYAYTTGGQISSVTRQKKLASGSWQTVRSIELSYLTMANVGAPVLKGSIEKAANGGTVGETYARYYTSEETGGYAGALKYYFGEVATARLRGAFPSTTDLDSLTDAQVEPYADKKLRYDGDTKAVVEYVKAGAGCSACSGGQGSVDVATSTNPDPFSSADVNDWRYKISNTYDDGSVHTTYSNQYNQTLLQVVVDASGTTWRSYTRYDSANRVLFTAAPSAVTGFSESLTDLIGYSSSGSTYLAASSGLITNYVYGTSTTATDSTVGDVEGYVKSVSIQRGTGGTAIVQSAQTYIARTADGIANYHVASSTRYRNDNGTGAETVTTAYTWQGSTAQAASMTTTLPTVTTAQNGPNTATSMTQVFDSEGRLTWSKDAIGVLSYNAYDALTGALVKSIQDVNTANTSDFAGLPSGWTTPSGAGQHLISTYEVDTLGRTTKSTDPLGIVSYTVYNDVTQEVRSYPAWNSTTNAPTGPISVYRDDWTNGYSESLTMSATPAVSGGRPTGAEAISNLQSLSRAYRNEAGQTVTQDQYFNLTSLTYSTAANIGTVNANYYRTAQGYDKEGRPNKTVSALGTITRTVYDAMGHAVSTWVGTNDTPTTGFWSPTNAAGLVKVTETEYDHGLGGDGNATQTTQYPGGGAAARVSQTFFDWRNRPVAAKAGVETSEATTVNRPIRYAEYDNLSQTITTELYDGDAVTITDENLLSGPSGDGVPDRPSSGLLRAKATSSYDELGRVFQSVRYSVNPSTGSVNSYGLTSQTWFDLRGLTIKTSAPGGLVQKTAYDSLGRATTAYTTDGGGDTGYADADDVTGDMVLSQSESTYDADGNVLLSVQRDRAHTATGTGALATDVRARSSYSAMYYDGANRPVASVNVGTNGGTAYTRPSTLPSRSDTVLVTTMEYDAAGRTFKTLDPKALESRTYYDALGRTTKTIENYVDGTPSNADDKTTEYAYNGVGMTSLTAKLAGGAFQTTQWIYGVTTTAGNGIDSNDIVSATHWPDASTGAASSGQADTVTVNALGQTVTTADRNGTVHSLDYDVLGRVINDRVTTLGTGIDGSVRRYETSYDILGGVKSIVGYSATAAGTVTSGIQRDYNGFGQLLTEYQAHGAAVDTATTPKVQYTYSLRSGVTNHSRITGIVYPNGRVVSYDYGTGLNDSISRLSAMKDGSTTLESYNYLGLGAVVERLHPESGVDLSYVKLSSESTGDAGDQYTGLDRFGRVIDQRWRAGTVDKDRYTYGYDRDGNRLTKSNALNSSLSEVYTYDGLNQLVSSNRGSGARTQSWTFDALGNWTAATTDSTTQTRTANQQNEITAISGATTPTYDASGNMITDETGKQFVYDAWGFLKVVKNSSGTVLETLSYDGLHRKTGIATTVTTDLYYSSSWQVLEERVGGVVKDSYVWSPVYVDAMVARDRDADGSIGNGLEERLYVAQDANFNVTALISRSGAVLERMTFDAYGMTQVRDAAWNVQTTSGYAWLYLHQGGRWDATSGLYGFRMREYSPTLGRWVSMDPIGYRGGRNLYKAYSSAPVVLVDPQGTDPFDWLSRRIYRTEVARGERLDQQLVEHFAKQPVVGERQIKDSFCIPDKLTGKWQMSRCVGPKEGGIGITHSWLEFRGACPDNAGQFYTYTDCNIAIPFGGGPDFNSDKNSTVISRVTRMVDNPIIPKNSPTVTCSGYTAYAWAINTGHYEFIGVLTSPQNFGLHEQLIGLTSNCLLEFADAF